MMSNNGGYISANDARAAYKESLHDETMRVISDRIEKVCHLTSTTSFRADKNIDFWDRFEQSREEVLETLIDLGYNISCDVFAYEIDEEDSIVSKVNDIQDIVKFFDTYEKSHRAVFDFIVDWSSPKE